MWYVIYVDGEVTDWTQSERTALRWLSLYRWWHGRENVQLKQLTSPAFMKLYKRVNEV